MVGRHARPSHQVRRGRWALALALMIGAGVVFIATGARSPHASSATPTVVDTLATTTTSTTIPPTVTLAAVGDTELGNTPQLPPDPTAYLGAMKAALAAPIVFGNLEGTITDLTAPKCDTKSLYCYAFRVPTSYARVYRSAGFTVLNSANNHAYDFLQAGATATTAALRAAGIVQAGLPGQIGVATDGTLKVAFVDFAPYYNTNNLLDQSAAVQLIARAKQLANVVVVYMHAGAEGPLADHVTRATESFVGENRGNPYAFAHAAIDAGADLVVASGPHVLRGIEWYHGHLIDYSLGDFVNYYNFATVGDLRLSAILHVTLGATGAFASARFTSLVLEPSGAAQLDPTSAAATLVNQLSKQDFGAAAATILPNGAIATPSAG